MLTFLKWLAALLGLLVVVFVLVLTFVDFGRFKPEIEQAVSEAIGRDFRIDGELEIRLLPSPRLSMENVTLANADWGSAPQLADIGHLSAELGLWSLVSGPPVIRQLAIRDVDVVLETRDDGTGNWTMGDPAAAEAPAEPAEDDPEQGGSLDMPVDIRSADIRNITLNYRPAGAEETVFAIDALGIDVNEAEQHVIQGSGRWMQWPLSLAAIAGNRNVELDAAAGELRIKSTIDYPTDTVNITAVFSTLDQMGRLIEVEGLPVADVSLDGGVSVRGDTISLSNVVATLKSAEVSVDGEISGDGSAQLAIKAAGSSLSDLDPGLPALPFRFSTDLVVAGRAATFEPFDLRFGDSNLQGRALLSGGEAPVVELRATSSLIDLAPFETSATETEESGAASEPAEPASDPEPEPAETDAQYVFTEERLPLEELRSARADVEVLVDRLNTAVLAIEDLEITLVADNGRIELDNSFRGTAGGEFENRVRLDASEDTAQLTLQAGGNGIKLGLMSGPDLPEAERPPTNLDINLESRGSSARALAASTNGKVVITQGAGRIANNALSAVSGDVIAQLFSALNPLAETEKYTNWECSAVALDFTDGVGEMTAFLLQSEKLMVVAAGGLDLNTERLDFEFNTKPREGVGLSADMFVTPFVKLSGTLASPGVGLNAKGALLSGGAAVMTGGLSFLYKGLMDRATAQGDRCAEVLQQVSASAAGGAGSN